MKTDRTEALHTRMARAIVRRAAETRVAWKLIEAAVMPAIGELHFGAVEGPPKVTGFEDLAFLFNPTGLNYGLISQSLDEAAYLYGVASSLPERAIAVEIGRFKGGSTFLLAAAMPAGGTVHSYDLHLETPPGLTGGGLDAGLEAALGRHGMAGAVELHVADSRKAPFPSDRIDLLFVDGDHSYEGVRMDAEHWLPAMREGGDVLFHDAAPTSGYPRRRCFPGVRRLISELRAHEGLAYQGSTGSLVHFRVTADLGQSTSELP